MQFVIYFPALDIVLDVESKIKQGNRIRCGTWILRRRETLLVRKQGTSGA